MEVPPLFDILTVLRGWLISPFRSFSRKPGVEGTCESGVESGLTGGGVVMGSVFPEGGAAMSGTRDCFVSLPSGVLRNTESKRMMGNPSCLNYGSTGVVSSKTTRCFASSKPSFS
jgi:hypothetical protein